MCGASRRRSDTRCSRTAARREPYVLIAMHRQAAAEPSFRRCLPRRFSCGVVLHSGTLFFVPVGVRIRDTLGINSPIMIKAFSAIFISVFLAEIGDKTQ